MSVRDYGAVGRSDYENVGWTKDKRYEHWVKLRGAVMCNPAYQFPKAESSYVPND